MELVVVRHGQSIWNLENLFTGWTDVELTEQGKSEAAEAGRASVANDLFWHREPAQRLEML